MNKVGVFIGRFQPFHDGHKRVVEKVLEEVDKLIIIVGSSYSFKTFKDPFSYNTRKEMIVASISNIDNSKIEIYPVEDYEEDFEWVNMITNIVNNSLENESEYSVTLYGFKKDDSSYYLDLFPKWDFKEIQTGLSISSTDIRNSMYIDLTIPNYVNNHVNNILTDYLCTNEFKLMQKEYNHHIEFKKKWSYTPHEVQFITLDSLILSHGHIVLIKRDQFPCKNSLSLIGGFAKPTERLLQGAIRIVNEKTGINLSKINMTKQVYQDKPNRSLRGRTLTHAFLFEVPYNIKNWNGIELIPINTIDQYKHLMFEDHYFIIKKLISK